MKIHLCSAYPEHNALHRFRHAAELDQVGAHHNCDSPEEADAILFVEDAHFDDYLYRRLRAHPHLTTWRHKCFMYNEVDQPWAVLPGLYCSMPNWSFEPGRQRACAYAATPNERIESARRAQGETPPARLFSFVGAGCNRLRKRLMRAASTQGGTVVDTSGFNVWDCDPAEKQRQGEVFASTLLDSQFALCPRGLGTSSFRLFEAMQAGRVPVIIADAWVPPAHGDWSFAVRIPERHIDQLGARLGALADESAERGRLAREHWLAHYAPERFFHTAGEDLRALLDRGDQHHPAPHRAVRREQVRLGSAVNRATSGLRQLKRRFAGR